MVVLLFFGRVAGMNFGHCSAGLHVPQLSEALEKVTYGSRVDALKDGQCTASCVVGQD